ncbi:hypothetical protein ACRJ4W_12945 [Streptomyces sp. GLT-R25]
MRNSSAKGDRVRPAPAGRRGDDGEAVLDAHAEVLRTRRGDLARRGFVAERMDVDADRPDRAQQGDGEFGAVAHEFVLAGVVEQDTRGACRHERTGREGRQRELAPAALGGEPALGDGELPGGRGRGHRLGQRHVEAQPVVRGLVQERGRDPYERFTGTYFHERLHRCRHDPVVAQIAVGGERGGPRVDAGDSKA